MIVIRIIIINVMIMIMYVLVNKSLNHFAFLFFLVREIVETSRRLLLTAVLSVLGPGTAAQMVIGILIALLSTKLYSLYLPHLKMDNGWLQEAAQYQILLTLLGAFILQTGNKNQ